jgi:hypothetical protein
MNYRKKKLYRLIATGSKRIDFNLDIQNLIRNNFLFTNLLRLKIMPQEFALLRLQKMGVLANDSCDESD